MDFDYTFHLQPNIKLLWSRRTPSFLSCAAVYTNNVVYIADNKHHTAKRDRQNTHLGVRGIALLISSSPTSINHDDVILVMWLL